MAKSKKERKGQSNISKLIAKCSSFRVRDGRSSRLATPQEKIFICSSQVFSQFSSSEIPDAFTELNSKKSFKGLTNLSLVRPANQTFRPLFDSGDIQKSIAWNVQSCLTNSTEVKHFLHIESKITNSILLGSNNESVELINELISRTGYSYWAHCLYSGIVVLDQELDAQPHESIMEDFSANSFLNYIVSYGCAYYKDMDIFFTVSEMDRNIYRRSKGAFHDAIEYFIWPPKNITSVDYEKVLSAVKNSSIVDIYTALIGYVKQSFLNEESFRGSDGAGYIVNKLSKNLDDPVIKNGLVKLDRLEYSDADNDGQLLDLFELYENGRYRDVVDIANSDNNILCDFDIFEIVVRSNLRVNSLQVNGFSKKLVDAMRSLILRDRDYKKHQQQLVFISYSLRSIRWFSKLMVFVWREGEFLSSSDRDMLEKYTAVSMVGHTSRKGGIFGEQYMSYLLQKFPKYNCIQIENDLGIKRNARFTINSAPLELSMLKIKAKINLCRHMEVIENLHTIIDKNDDPVITIEAKRLLVDCLLETGKSERAVSIFVSECIKDINYASIYDIDSIARCAINEFKFSGLVDYPIFLSIYSRVKGPDYDAQLKYSFEVFLTKNGLIRPEELFSSKWTGDSERTKYFLKWVCTQETMNLYVGFASPKDIEDCRLNICSQLISSGDNSDTLANEVIEINRKKVSRLAAQRVNSSRIHVDTSIFIGRKSEQFRILFDRFLSYESEGLDKDEITFESIITELTAKGGLEGFDIYSVLSSIYVQDINLSKKNATFLSLCKLFREVFTYGEKGLNNHLSTRIRHGVLPTAYEKPFSGESLLLGENGENDNRHTKHGPFPSVIRLLQEFTTDFYNHISEINDNYLQIRAIDSSSAEQKNISTEGKGKFNYSISPIESYMVQKALPISPKYDDLVKVIISWLWKRTDFNLDLVREIISKESQNFLFSRLDQLVNDLSKKSLPENIKSELCNAISRVKSRIPTQIVTVCSWFHRSDSVDESQAFDLVTAIELARDSLSLVANISDTARCKIPGKSLSYFVDIFHILFENAISKSGLARDHLDIMVKIQRVDDVYKLVISNRTTANLSSSSDLAFYREAYGDEALIKDVIQQEGGTGLFKIWKILEKDLGIYHKSDFQFTNNDRFEVVFFLNSGEAIFSD